MSLHPPFSPYRPSSPRPSPPRVSPPMPHALLPSSPFTPPALPWRSSASHISFQYRLLFLDAILGPNCYSWTQCVISGLPQNYPKCHIRAPPESKTPFVSERYHRGCNFVTIGGVMRMLQEANRQVSLPFPSHTSHLTPHLTIHKVDPDRCIFGVLPSVTSSVSHIQCSVRVVSRTSHVRTPHPRV